MADIDVVPKRRSLTWLWILAAIVIVALILWALMGNNDPSPVGLVTPGDSESERRNGVGTRPVSCVTQVAGARVGPVLTRSCGEVIGSNGAM